MKSNIKVVEHKAFIILYTLRNKGKNNKSVNLQPSCIQTVGLPNMAQTYVFPIQSEI